MQKHATKDSKREEDLVSVFNPHTRWKRWRISNEKKIELELKSPK